MKSQIRTHTCHAKQLARQAVREATELPMPANKLEVCRALDVRSGVQPGEE